MYDILSQTIRVFMQPKAFRTSLIIRDCHATESFHRRLGYVFYMCLILSKIRLAVIPSLETRLYSKPGTIRHLT